jgi:hypothetical protein
MTSRWTSLFDAVAPSYDAVVPSFATFGELLVRHCDLAGIRRVLGPGGTFASHGRSALRARAEAFWAWHQSQRMTA